jgi:hypothetical protein
MDQPTSNKDLRSFGLLVGGVFTVIGLWPILLRGEPVRLWAIGAGGLLVVSVESYPPSWRRFTSMDVGWACVGMDQYQDSPRHRILWTRHSDRNCVSSPR